MKKLAFILTILCTFSIQAQSYWDNTIEYKEGGDATPFTLTYIENNISAPSTAYEKYVAVGASATGTGSSLDDPMTIEAAFAEATPNTTYWIKAGEYGHKHLVLNVTTTTETTPIKFIGYKDNKEDITVNYLIGSGGVNLEADGKATYNNLYSNNGKADFDTSKMPTLTGRPLTTATDDRNIMEYGNVNSEDIALKIISAKYIFIENMQFRQYSQGIQKLGTDHTASHIVLNNLNGYDFLQRSYVGTEETYGYFIDFESRTGTSNQNFTHSDHIKLTNIVAAEANTANIFVLGYGYNLFKRIFTYSNLTSLGSDPSSQVKDNSDYHITFNGNYNVVTDCYSRAPDFKGWYADGSSIPFDNQVGGHGIGVRASTNWQSDDVSHQESSYNLIEKSVAVNMTEGFYFRNYGANKNVIKNCKASRINIDHKIVGTSTTEDYQEFHNLSAFVVWSGDDNIIENSESDGYHIPIHIVDNLEDEMSDKIGQTIGGRLITLAMDFHVGSNNIFRNIKAKNFFTAIVVEGSKIDKERAEYTATDIANMGEAFNNKFVNCTFKNGYKYLADSDYVKIDKFDIINSSFENIITPDGYVDSSNGKEYPEYPINKPLSTTANDKFNFYNCNFWNLKGGSGTLNDWLPDVNTNAGVSNLNVDGININPNLDANLKPTASTPSDFYNGGQTRTDVPFDFKGVKRTAPYSIGAYEFGTDTESPTAVADLSSSDVEQTSLTLTWTASTDNVGVVDYEVFQEGISIGSTGGATTFDVTGLIAGSTYHFTVYAKDGNGNVSEVSNVYEVTTIALITNLYTYSDAASMALNSNSIDSGWNFPNWGVDVSSVEDDNGNYFLRCRSADEDGPYAGMGYSFQVISGKQYRVKFKAKVNQVNGQSVTVEGTDKNPSDIVLTTSWQNYSLLATADTTGEAVLIFYSGYLSGVVGDQLDFDDIIIEQVSISKNSNTKRKDEMNQFTVYPNPANNSFTIELNNNLEKKQITISDVFGRLVYKKETSTNKLIINHNFSQGVYIINVKNNEENVYKKIIIE